MKKQFKAIETNVIMSALDCSDDELRADFAEVKDDLREILNKATWGRIGRKGAPLKDEIKRMHEHFSEIIEICSKWVEH